MSKPIVYSIGVYIILALGTILGIVGIGAFATYVSEANDFHRIEERNR